MDRSPFNIGSQNENVTLRIVAALERISQAFKVLLWNESKELSLSPIQIQILIFLLHHTEEKRKVSYLAQEFNLTKATISDSVKVLEQKGLIKKDYNPEDTRSFAIDLTQKGNQIANKVSLFANEFPFPIDQLSPDDKENLLLSLLNIIRHLNKIGVITIQRMCLTCSHYKPMHEGNPHFCQLLNQKLQTSDLRIDCPEHQLTS